MNVVGPPDSAAVCAPLKVQVIVNQVPVAAVTASENVTVMLADGAMHEAPVDGVVAVTLGAASPALHGANVDDVLRGLGTAAEKSLLLLSVSVQPPTARNAAVVAVSVGAAAVSEKLALP